jgi:hypothetical protein
VPLRHVLYRCPLCGHDPTGGQGDEVECPGCHATFCRAQRGILVRTVDGESVEAMPQLVDRIRAHGGPVTAATNADGSIRYSADAVYQGILFEEPLRKGGRLLGYVEHPRRPQEGLLEATEWELSFRAVGLPDLRWPLRDVAALQVSTRSLQIGVRYMGTVQFSFPAASTFRWEELLQHLLREAWRREGRGEVTEFQPRLTAR